MHSSVPQPCPVTHEFGDAPAEERLRGLDRDQLADRLTWLAWWAPGTFTAVMDYMQFVDDHAADGTLDCDDSDDPAPYCLTCGSEVGIFIRYSLGWRHYRVTDQSGIELFDPGHTPEVGWRTAPPIRV
jgi:hypothetical protein